MNGEACDGGASNADAPAVQISQPGGTTFVSGPVQRFTEARFFYGLVSASAHTGYEAASTSNLFLYRDFDTGLVSLFAVHGIDFSTTGVMQPRATVTFAITGVPTGTTAVISDDMGEFVSTGTTSYAGNWLVQNNTDA